MVGYHISVYVLTHVVRNQYYLFLFLEIIFLYEMIKL